MFLSYYFAAKFVERVRDKDGDYLRVEKGSCVIEEGARRCD